MLWLNSKARSLEDLGCSVPSDMHWPADLPGEPSRAGEQGPRWIKELLDTWHWHGSFVAEQSDRRPSPVSGSLKPLGVRFYP